MAFAVLVIGVSAGCGQDGADPDPVSSAPPIAPAEEVAAIDRGAKSVVAVAPDLYRTIVATVRPEVTIVDTFDAPWGNLVSFDFPVTNPTYFGSAQTMRVLERDPSGQWLRVQLPVRPNHSQAWILASSVTLSVHRFHGTVDVSDRLVRFFDGDALVAETVAVVGADDTPTPLGDFYVNEILPQDNPGGAYGPYIFGLSAFSEALETFAGGIPVIALHGTNHPEWVGQARSNGCVRMPNEIASLLASTIPPGTPVQIVA